MTKTVWIVHQYASTPEKGMGGRHYYIGRELAKQGYKVYLIASASHHLLRETVEINERFKIENIANNFHIVWVKMPEYSEAHSRQRALNWFLFPWKIQRLFSVIADRPDVLLASSPSPFVFLGAQRLARKFKARLVFEVRDIWPLTLIEIGGYTAKHPFIRTMQWIEDKAYRNADKVVTNLKNAKSHMVSRGMHPDKFVWIPNGFSLDETNQNIPLNTVSYSKIPKDKFIVGYTGTLGVANALNTLIEAAEILRNYPDIVFALVGKGKEREALEESVAYKKLRNVIFVGEIPKVEVHSMLSLFDTCYIGLLEEPLFRFGVSPNKLFDYLYSGKPILYGIESGDYKPIDEAKAGFQIPAEDPQRLAESILKLYRMPEEERAILGANGRAVAIEQYEYGKLAEKLAKVLFGPLEAEL